MGPSRWGRTRSARPPPSERAGEADQLGQRAGAEADEDRDHDEDDDHEVEPVHASSMGEAPRPVGPGPDAAPVS